MVPSPQRLDRGVEIVGRGAVVAHLGDAGVVGDQHAVEAELAAQHVLAAMRLLADMGTPPGPVLNAGITEGAPAADAGGVRRQVVLARMRALRQIDIRVVLAALGPRRSRCNA